MTALANNDIGMTTSPIDATSPATSMPFEQPDDSANYRPSPAALDLPPHSTFERMGAAYVDGLLGVSDLTHHFTTTLKSSQGCMAGLN